MNKLLFLSLIALSISSSSKNLILIGDSRYVGMAAYLIGIPYDGKNIRTTTAKGYSGYSIQCTAQVSASYSTYAEGGELYQSVINQLSSAQANTNVLLWLGINSVWAPEQTYNFYVKLAQKYPKLSFYAVAITGVNEQRWPTVHNSSVRQFNSNLKSKLNGAGCPKNLKYADILKNDNPTLIISSGKEVDISTASLSPDGLHYTKDGYYKLFFAMVAKIN